MATAVNITEGLTRAATLIMNDCSHLGVGTSEIAAIAGDAQLGVETNRMAATNKFQTGTRFQIRGLFTNSNMPATIEELALFMNASSGPNSGEMLIKISDEFTKGSDDLLVIFDVTIE
tara:strand:- start:4948 stop:5301 length:354 start_codon:yes stop_codon:yes gene_type:complete